MEFLTATQFTTHSGAKTLEELEHEIRTRVETSSGILPPEFTGLILNYLLKVSEESELWETELRLAECKREEEFERQQNKLDGIQRDLRAMHDAIANIITKALDGNQ